MKIATILPTAHIWLEDEADYHLCLAHHLRRDMIYTFFFRKQVRDKRYVIMDNGAAENGIPMKIDSLLSLVEVIECQEIVLPDTIHDAEATLKSSYAAVIKTRKVSSGLKIMTVPHGKNVEEWRACVYEMFLWDIDTIGISKFIVPNLFPSRVEALISVQELILSDKDIHLLGYTGVKDEISEIEERFPGRIRGVDSSIPTLYAQRGEEMKDSGRPEIDLRLDAKLDEELLKRNIRRWKESCSIL